MVYLGECGLSFLFSIVFTVVNLSPAEIVFFLLFMAIFSAYSVSEM